MLNRSYPIKNEKQNSSVLGTIQANTEVTEFLNSENSDGIRRNLSERLNGGQLYILRGGWVLAMLTNADDRGGEEVRSNADIPMLFTTF